MLIKYRSFRSTDRDSETYLTGIARLLTSLWINQGVEVDKPGVLADQDFYTKFVLLPYRLYAGLIFFSKRV